MTYHETVKKIQDLLRVNNVWFESFEHEPVRTSEEAAMVRPEYAQHQGSKSLIVYVRTIAADAACDKRFVMLVIPGDMQFDKKK